MGSKGAMWGSARRARGGRGACSRRARGIGRGRTTSSASGCDRSAGYAPRATGSLRRVSGSGAAGNGDRALFCHPSGLAGHSESSARVAQSAAAGRGGRRQAEPFDIPAFGSFRSMAAATAAQPSQQHLGTSPPNASQTRESGSKLEARALSRRPIDRSARAGLSTLQPPSLQQPRLVPFHDAESKLVPPEVSSTRPGRSNGDFPFPDSPRTLLLARW